MATLAWNNHRHFELYYGVSGMGSIPQHRQSAPFPRADRLHHQPCRRRLCLRLNLPAPVDGVAPHRKGAGAWVALTDRALHARIGLDLLCYEDLINAHSDDFEWPQFDETTASCQHLGTTGNLEGGALFVTARLVLHAHGLALPDALNLSARDTVLPGAALPRSTRSGPGPMPAARRLAPLVMPGRNSTAPACMNSSRPRK
ncbi:MAG: hypothetical protein M5R42_05565 [Rhodocyclaceae bacterium]|nr:hypothetical protein [Rhodocyclaceae bacterium]